MAYDAFISYSHAADGLLAPRLQAGLQRFAKPLWRRQALRVFRDQTGLSVNPHLWSSVSAALDEAEWFVLLASPQAAASPWVNREIDYWKQHKDPARILPVLTEGTWVWDEIAGDFDWAASTAVPEALRGVYQAEPRHLDLCRARTDGQLDLHNGRFRDHIADLAAPMHGIAKDELESDDIRQHRRTLRLAWSAAAMLLILFLGSVAGAVAATRSAAAANAARTEADAQTTLAQQSATEASHQRTIAETNATEANTQKTAAQTNASEASRQKTAAQANATEAETQKQAAEANAAEAETQSQLAKANAAASARNAEIAQTNAAQATAAQERADDNAQQSAANAALAHTNEATALTNAAEADLQRTLAEAKTIEAKQNADEALANAAIAQTNADQAAANAAAAQANADQAAANAREAQANATLADQRRQEAEDLTASLAAKNDELVARRAELEAINTQLTETNTLLSIERLGAQGQYFHDVSPIRILDSRTSLGGFSSPWHAGETRDIAVIGSNGVPENATGVVVNVTVTGTTEDGYLTLYPAGTTRPATKNLSFSAGQTVPQLVVTPIGANRRLSIYNAAGSTDIIIDLVGYFDTDDFGSVYHGVTVNRIAADLPLGAGETRTLPVTGGSTGVPEAATAIVVDLIVDSSAASWLTVWATGDAQPNTSNLNYSAGGGARNLAVIPIGDADSIDLYNNTGTIAMDVDVVGYMVPGHPDLPRAPREVTATITNGQADVSWLAPRSPGTTPITSYTVTASPGGSTCTWTAGPLACIVDGLTNGIWYTFTVRAVNDAGPGAPASTQPRAFEGAPGNDSFARAYVWDPGIDGAVTESTSGATAEPGEPLHAGRVGGASVWFTYTPTVSGPVAITNQTYPVYPYFNELLAVYTGTAVDQLIPVAAIDFAHVLQFEAVAGQTYHIAIDGRSASTGQATLSIADPPPNDTFADALTLDAGVPVDATTVDASSETGEPVHGGQTGASSIWFTYTATTDASLVLDATTSNFTTGVAVYTGTAVDQLTEIAAGTDGRVRFDPIAGQTYHLAVDGYYGEVKVALLDTPANDDFADARTINAGPLSTGSTIGATSEPGEPLHAGYPAGASVWFAYTPAATGPVVIRPADTVTGMTIAVYTGGDLHQLVPVGAVLGGWLRFDGVAGQTYRIAAQGKDAVGIVVGGPPTNDAFAAASPVALGVTTTGTTTGAANEPGEPNPSGGEGRSVWYRFKATGANPVRITTYNAGYLPIAAFTGTSVGGLDPVMLTHDDVDNSYILLPTAGTTYNIAVTDAGDFELRLDLVPVPANDDFADATPLTASTPEYATTLGATAEPGEPDHAAANGKASVWYTYTATVDGPVSVSTSGSAFDTVLGVYRGASLTTLTEVAANDDAVTGDPTSALTFEATAGQTYRIAVDGVGGAMGDFDVLLYLPVPNDNFGQAQPVGLDTPVTGTTVHATAEPGEPVGFYATAWYTYTAPASQPVSIDLTDSSYNTVAVFTGSSVDQLTSVGAGTFTAVAGQTYAIAVRTDSYPSAFTLTLRAAVPPANDAFAAAQPLSLATPVTGTTVDATREPGETGRFDQSVWYTYTAPDDRPVAVDISWSAGFDVYTGTSVDNLTPVVVSFIGGAYVFVPVPGERYAIAAGTSSIPAPFTLEVTIAPDGPPLTDNDDFANGTEIFLGDTALAHSFSATSETGEPLHAGVSCYASVWFTYTATTNATVTITTAGSDFDTLLGIYTGSSVDTLTEVASNDDEVPGSIMTSRANFMAVAGQTYHIAVDGYAGATGFITLAI